MPIFPGKFEWSSAGSEWWRWDPHIHAPGTLLSDQFKGDWEAYLQRIEQAIPTVRALGVTDYFCIQSYQNVQAQKRAGRLRNVKLIFPNVEMRLDIKTQKHSAINLHLIFSPEDPNHEFEIERILGHLLFEFSGRKYRCTIAELADLGRAFDPAQTHESGAIRVGANQFKTTLGDLRDLFRSESWLRNNCLVAVAGGLGDGTAGLQADNSFAATRREIESFADIIFASTPSQREYWLGKKGTDDRAFIERTYGSLKPCLHGSDAHRDEAVVAPDLNRYCWLKGDPDFETLRQAVIEPEERVWIGEAPPTTSMPSMSIRKLEFAKMPWLGQASVELNAGLVAVIGARGSGKTALVDMIAAGTSAIGPVLGESSFLKRASQPIDYLEDASINLTCGDQSRTSGRLSLSRSDNDWSPNSETRYLSQHFVNQLCSAEGLATELRREMERVVFEATDQSERLETDSFEELASILLENVRRRREEMEEAIRSTGESIVQQELLRDRLPIANKERQALTSKIAKDRKELATLIPKGKEARARTLSQLEQACNALEAKIENLRRRERTLSDLETEIEHIDNNTEPARLQAMRERFVNAELAEPDWNRFGMTFVGDVKVILEREKRLTARAIAALIEGDPAITVDPATIQIAELSLKELRIRRDATKKEVGIDVQQQKRYEALQRAITQQEVSVRRLEAEIRNGEGAEERRSNLIELRRVSYSKVFNTLIEEEAVLEHLYKPLRDELTGATGALAKLQFVVKRNVDLDAWVEAGEHLLDLRMNTGFRGHGALRDAAERYLLGPWSSGTADEVATAMDHFRAQYAKDLVNARPSTVTLEERQEWIQSVATWLFGTSHIRIVYSIEYDGVAIEQLSPGTRGIVLLLLYLVVDRQDRRPLIVDQPEENLDPRSVFDELVPHFREARKRRQVIIVTHNANLVVNTDADQVIVATATRGSGEGLPTISYKSGGLENPEIRRMVCEILEGGERAFKERARRYRLFWEDANIRLAAERGE